jgi:hypothetical protein
VDASIINNAQIARTSLSIYVGFLICLWPWSLYSSPGLPFPSALISSFGSCLVDDRVAIVIDVLMDDCPNMVPLRLLDGRRRYLFPYS